MHVSKKHLLEFFTTVVSYLFVLLFVYTAVSKLLDFENFQVQLGQSPMLSVFAGWVSWGVILIELFVSGLLLLDKTRRLGLYLAFVLMAMFTTYIIIILNFSSFVPCSCGGVLEKMGWRQHLIFNIVFLVLAVPAFIVSIEIGEDYSQRLKKTAILLSTSFFVSVGLVALLFVLSEDIMQHRNNFVRRFPPHPAILEHQVDLNHNSYYITGIEDDRIYLGNITALLYIKILNWKLQTISEDSITLPNRDLPFRTPKVLVTPPDFYFMDGYVPVIFQGQIGDWNAAYAHKVKAFFSLSAYMDTVTFVIRARDSKTNEHILGVLRIGDSSSVKLSRDLLVKQIDGVFDTDGTLIYNKQLEKIIYTYYYRNQFIVADKTLALDYVGKTIDTISGAQLKVTISLDKGSQLSAPPLVVNKHIATFGNYLFVNSGLMGQFEPRDTWQKSSVIDVYDLVKNTYSFSFYIPDIERKKMSEFYVYGNRFFCITDNYLQVYTLDDTLFDSSISEWKAVQSFD